ncbi:MAG: hypothetical protein U0165_02580 [Polyangiaceae bacterium]
MVSFLRADHCLISVDRIRSIDTTRLEALELVVHHDGGSDIVTGANAVEALMQLKPSVLEGRRLRWVRHAWVIHNLIGHPLLQLCAWLGQRELGLKIHDLTVPRPQAKVR